MKSINKKIRVLCVVTALLSTTACAALPDAAEFKPRQEPYYNMTQSSQVLECVGAMIDYSPGPGVDVYISDIPDHTIPSIEAGFLTKNAVMMVTTAIDRLNTEKVQVVGRNGADPRRRQVQLIGSFTELNRTTASDALSGEVVLPGGFSFDLGHDENYNHIALDMALSEFNRVIPHTGTSVSVQIHGSNGDVTVTYDKGSDFAANVGGGFTAQEGFHAAQRLLVETSVAMMMSKYYGVNIANCLQRAKSPEAKPMTARYDRPVFASAQPAPAYRTSQSRRAAPAPLTVIDGPAPTMTRMSGGI